MSNKAPSISVPKGGGSVSGLGEKFSPDLFTGTGNFSVPIAVPAGRNGFQPELTLGYSTGNGNSAFGLGWALGVPGVNRKTSKGIPVYDDEKDVFILSGAEDLVPLGTVDEFALNGQGTQVKIGTITRYRPRTEGLFARIEHVKRPGTAVGLERDFWRVHSKDGLVSYYGSPEEAPSHTDSPVEPNPDQPGNIFAWLLYQTKDTFGNQIRYRYEKTEVKEEQRHYCQLLLKSIEYADYKVNGITKFLLSVDFTYGNRPDPFSAYSAGFEVRTTQRCTRISSYTHPLEVDAPEHYAADPETGRYNVLVKTYELRYLDERIDLGEKPVTELPLNSSSLLSQVIVQGHRNQLNAGNVVDAMESMPPLEFSYTRFDPAGKDFFPVEGAELPYSSLSSPDLELVDLMGNGLPDIVQLNGVARYWKNLGNGRFDRPRSMKEAPAGLHLADPDVQMLDANGDGRADLLVNREGLTGYFPLRFGAQWDHGSFRKYEQRPSFSFADPEVRLLDLDGDGITDVLRNGSRLELFYNHPVKGFHRMQAVEKGQLSSFPNISLTDPRVKMGRLCASLQTFVMVHNGSVEYWPNLGHGKWGKRVRMTNSPRFPYGYNPARILIGDVDGDGLDDLLYIENNKVTLWINQSGNSWSEPIEITGTPQVTDADSIRLTDLLGTGVSGLMWTRDASVTRSNQQYLFLDLTGRVKPYLLSEMNNHMGALTRVQYTSSATFFVEDDRRPETRWKTPLPFPVLVVSKVEVLDQISKGKMTTEYKYRHGYWDGGEREFRGFGRVDQRDTESFADYNAQGLHSGSFNTVSDTAEFSPPVETRSWFHLGPVGDEYGEWEEADFSSEYWQEDPQQLERPAGMKELIRKLPRRARRDAYRALRGTVLRTELYALDGSPLKNRPYTVTEGLSGVSLVEDELSGTSPTAVFSHFLNETGTDVQLHPNRAPGEIFFAHSLGQRTTQWERGIEPMTQFSFSADYDKYGQVQTQLSLALPRNPTASGAWWLGTLSRTERIHLDTPGQYMTDRVKSTRLYDVSAATVSRADMWDYRDELLAAITTAPIGQVIGHSLNFYDGDAFAGEIYGSLGAHGVLVRSETLMLTNPILQAAYGSTPQQFTGLTLSADYPVSYQDQFRETLGYQYRQQSYHGLHYENGYYTRTEARRYDFQDSSITDPKGLVQATVDPMANAQEIADETRLTKIGYDSYQLLPIEVQDAVGMSTTAKYDYRLLQPWLVTDANGNRTLYGYSALGMLKETALLGKEGANEGDIIAEANAGAGTLLTYHPSTWMEMDLLAFYTTGTDPVWVKTVQREKHYKQSATSDTLQKTEYSDGFGRLLQTRTQAEKVLFGSTAAAPFGSSGLPDTQGAQNQSAVGVENTNTTTNPNVVVSGWQRYNNKGKVVEKWEPFFSTGWDYAEPTSDQKGKSVKMYYDPRGQVIRIISPDRIVGGVIYYTEQRVIYGIPLPLNTPGSFTPTPWEQYTYDANDLAPITHSPGTALANPVPNTHWYTPASAEVDALGRVIKSVERLGNIDSNQVITIEKIITSYEYDIRGNRTKVIDPLGRTAFLHEYDLRPRSGEGENEQGANLLKTTHLDSGITSTLFNALGNPEEASDAKGAWVLSGYDKLNRLTCLWARDTTAEPVVPVLRQRLVYGDHLTKGPSNPHTTNHKGRLYKHYDEAGLLTINGYDFKGNVLEKKRQVIHDAIIAQNLIEAADSTTSIWASVAAFRVDWETIEEDPFSPISYLSTTEYDALNRITRLLLPADINTARKELLPAYNRAGGLEKVVLSGTTYVERIAYNAKGQRLLLAMGNAAMTRYAYDAVSGRLKRIRTEKYLKTGFTYAPNSGMVQDSAYAYDLAGNILTHIDASTDAGIGGGVDPLTQLFEYDALYRLLSATGREIPDTTHMPWDEARHVLPANTKGYKRDYTYDKAGNMKTLKHTSFATPPAGGFTRTFNYYTPSGGSTPTSNLLVSMAVSVTVPRTYGYMYDPSGNQIREYTNRHTEWDYANRMKSFRNATSLSSEPTVYTHYLYDGAGNRVKKITRKSSSGVYEIAVYIDGMFEHRYRVERAKIEDPVIPPPPQPNPPLLSTYNFNLIHVMDDQSRIATVRIGSDESDGYPGIKYVVSDHLGSSFLQLAVNGGVMYREEFFAFGETSFGIYMSKRYRYCGKEQDEESRYYNYGARMYAPWLCRFLSVDPLAGETPHFSPYVYANDNPINMIDPDGRQSKSAPHSGHGQEAASGSSNTIAGGGPASSPPMTFDPDLKVMVMPEIEIKIQVDQVRKGVTMSNFPGTGFRKERGELYAYRVPKGTGDNSYGGVGFALGFTPAGTYQDLYTLFAGKDPFTDEKVSWGWRIAGVIPFASEFRKGNNFVQGVTSVVKQDSKLLKLAQETFEGNDLLRKEANGLIEQLNKGNMNPGIGSKNIGKNIFEARSRGGSRVYFRNGTNGVEIVGYSNKANQQQVINRILEVY